MLLNLLWLAFFVSAFAVALVRLAMGDLEVFPKLLAAMFDLASARAWWTRWRSTCSARPSLGAAGQWGVSARAWDLR